MSKNTQQTAKTACLDSHKQVFVFWTTDKHRRKNNKNTLKQPKNKYLNQNIEFSLTKVTLVHNSRRPIIVSRKFTAKIYKLIPTFPNMKRRIRRKIRESNKFRREFRKEIRLLILVTLGFTIAFTWRQTIFDASKSIVQFFTHVEGSTTLSILTSLFITLLSVILVYITSHFLKDDPSNY